MVVVGRAGTVSWSRLGEIECKAVQKLLFGDWSRLRRQSGDNMQAFCICEGVVFVGSSPVEGSCTESSNLSGVSVSQNMILV
jgi:hypothetical protein